MFCENCGAQIPDTAKFCRFCGASQTPVSGAAVSAPVSVSGQASGSGKNTEKQSLIDYLGALHTAEMGIIHSDELIKLLDAQKADYVRYHRAIWRAASFNELMPVRRDYIAEAQKEVDYRKKSISEFQDPKRYAPINNSWSAKIANLAVRMQFSSYDKKEVIYQKEALEDAKRRMQEAPAAQRKEDQRVAAEMVAYNRRKQAFEAHEALRKAAWDEEEKAVCKSFDESRQYIAVKRNDFAARRDALYAEERLFEQFRDPVAEYQLRQYLRMGLVDRLEGPQGGYSFYLDELNARRICGSIDELRKSMESRMDTMIEQMGELVQSLRYANRQLEGLRGGILACCTAIEDGFTRIDRNMDKSASRMTAQLREEITNQARPIREAVQRSEYNLYLDSMRKELDNYQYGRLREPPISTATEIGPNFF